MHVLNLKVFCDLVETGSFSTAASRNEITQSAVSQQIKTLEQRFGVIFFERGKKNFSITPEGSVFHAAALRILEIYRNIDADLLAVRNEVGGPLRLATVYSLGLHELPPLPEAPIRILDDRGHLRTLEEIERDLIQHAIEVYAGHMSEIARRLGIGRSTLYRKVREQGLEGQLKEAG